MTPNAREALLIQHMIARDQAQQAEGSDCIGWLIVGAVVVWCMVRAIQEARARQRRRRK